MFYLSKGTVHMLRGPYEVLAEMPGTALAGWTYDAPFRRVRGGTAPWRILYPPESLSGASACAAEAHRVILWDEVSETEGTGIVHIAPGCGADDFRLGKEQQLPIVAPLNDEELFCRRLWLVDGESTCQRSQKLICTALKQQGVAVPCGTVYASLSHVLALRC